MNLKRSDILVSEETPPKYGRVSAPVEMHPTNSFKKK